MSDAVEAASAPEHPAGEAPIASAGERAGNTGNALGHPLASAASRFANRSLGREAWAREQLVAHAGRVFTLAVGPALAGFRIDADGSFANASGAELTPDLRLTIAPLDVPAFLVDPRQWNQYVKEEGDAALGGTLKSLAQTLPWFVEQAFADALGPIVGRRLADAGRHLLAFPGHAAQRLAENVGRYARYETGLVVGEDELGKFTAETAALAARVDALEARIAALTASR